MNAFYNFAAGPSPCPRRRSKNRGRTFVLRIDGHAVMEISPREDVYRKSSTRRGLVRELMHVRGLVITSHGGAKAQFAAVPMKPHGPIHKADYVDSATSPRSHKELEVRFRPQRCFLLRSGYSRLPLSRPPRPSTRRGYFHITTNNTNFARYEPPSRTRGRPPGADMIPIF
jgi:phosphoserine aminotransferase